MGDLTFKPQFDCCGYPTESTLKRIRMWDIRSVKHDLLPWIQFCAEAIDQGSGRVSIDEFRYEFATGGWSGNEMVIEAMRANVIGWALCWWSSCANGVHQFRLLRDPE